MFHAKFVFALVQIFFDLAKPIKLNDVTDSNKADKPFKEKFNLIL